jgi:hypothetical protein
VQIDQIDPNSVASGNMAQRLIILKLGEDPPAAHAVEAASREGIGEGESEASHGAPLK